MFLDVYGRPVSVTCVVFSLLDSQQLLKDEDLTFRLGQLWQSKLLTVYSEELIVVNRGHTYL